MAMTRNKELYLPIALSMALTLVSGLLCGFLGGPWVALTGERVRSSHHTALDEHNMEPV